MRDILSFNSIKDYLASVIQQYIARQRRLSIPSRIISMIANLIAQIAENFQFHQGLSADKYFPAKGDVIGFQFHQGLS